MGTKIQANEMVRERHFVVGRVEKRQTRAGDDYFILELGDKDNKINGKIWNNALNKCHYETGKIIEVNGKTQEYNGTVDLIIDSCEVVNSEEAENFMPVVPTLVFDIECAGKDFEELDENEQDYLLNNLEKDTADKEIAKKKTALYSIFGIVVAIGCLDLGSQKGTVLAIGNKEIKLDDEKYNYVFFEDEKSLLEAFWQMASKYDRLVTYNGEGFDFPYLQIRSGVNRVKVTVDIRRNGNNSIDLQNKIRQNNRAFKLGFLCKALGVENPKEKGVEGEDVSELYKSGNYADIANYVSRDVSSTAKLYQIWKEYISQEL